MTQTPSNGKPGSKQALPHASAVGWILTVVLTALLGVVVWRGLAEQAALRWLTLAAGVVFLLAQLLFIVWRLSGAPRAAFALFYLAAWICAPLIAAGIEQQSTQVVWGWTMAGFAQGVLLGAMLLGAVGPAVLSDSWRSRLTWGLISLVLLAPWTIGVLSGLSPDAIVRGEPLGLSWRWFYQPAFVGTSALLLALLTTMIWLCVDYRGDDRRSFGVFAVLLALLPIGLLGRYVHFIEVEPPTRSKQRPSPTASAITTAAPSAPRTPGTKTTAPGSARLPADAAAYDCNNVVLPTRDIAAIRAGFSPDNWRASMIRLLEHRYPDAASLVGKLRDPSFFDAWFRQGRTSYKDAVMDLSTAVHESAHIVGLHQRRGRTHVLVLGKKSSLRFPIPKSFHRKEIKAELPAAINDLSYSSTYLVGKSGAQGIEMLLDELNAYTYSLFTAIAIADQLPKNIKQSSRDGLLVFMYYLQRYLSLARRTHTATYKAILKSPALRKTIVELYDRAACVVELSSPYTQLGINDGMLREHVYGDKALTEIRALRTP